MCLAHPKPDRKKRKVKRRTSQQIRSDWINLCLCLWGMLIVKRDGRCQWCGSTKALCGHHIVTRGSTAGYKLSWFDLDNGICLCRDCHGTAHGRARRRTIHEYVEFINKWLAEKGLSYESLKVSYSVIYKMDKSQIELQFNILRSKCEGMQIPYTESKKYQLLTRRLANG